MRKATFSRPTRCGLLGLAACLLTACVVPRVQPPLSEVGIARLEPDAFVMADGVRLPLRTWLPAGPPRALIVAVHGLNDYSAGYERTGAYLAARGFAVYAYDQRGFGRSPQHGIWPGGDRLADDAWAVARLVRQENPGIPLYALGESMGGAVLLRALQRHAAGWIDGVTLTAPAVWNRSAMPAYQRFSLRVLAHSWRGLKLSGRMLDRSPTDDAETLRYLRNDPLVIKKTRMDTLWGLANLMDDVTREPVTPQVPALVLYGAHDEIVPPHPLCTWLNAADGWHAALYPSGWHLLTRSRDGDRVLADLAAWFARPGAGLPSGADTGRPVERVCALASIPQAPLSSGAVSPEQRAYAW